MIALVTLSPPRHRLSRLVQEATPTALACGPPSGRRRSSRQLSSSTWRIPRAA